MSAPLSESRLAEIESAQLGEWLAGEWRTEYVEGDGEAPAYYLVKDADGTTLAELPDWAGPVATLLADAHESVPELLADNAGLRLRVAVLEFNAAHPVGTPVVVYPGARPELVPDARRIETRTRTVAWLANGQTPVVMVEDYGSWVALTHVDVIGGPS